MKQIVHSLKIEFANMKSGLIFLLGIGCILSFYAQGPGGIKTVNDEGYGDYYFDKENRPIINGRIHNLDPSTLRGLAIEISMHTYFN
ncbi:MAG: hypothetical protein AAFR66_17180, partial [Bacteroidota bacterium]